MVICVTGKYGVGKSTLSNILSNMTGFPVIDVDEIGHEVLELEKEKLVEEFGGEILKGGVIDRKKLGEIVFSDTLLLRKLERILHPKMRKIVLERVKTLKNAIVDCALLERMDLMGICDFIVTVVADFETVLDRKGVDEGFLKKMWDIQRDVRLVGIVVRNDGDIRELEEVAKRLVDSIRVLSFELSQREKGSRDRHTSQDEEEHIE